MSLVEDRKEVLTDWEKDIVWEKCTYSSAFAKKKKFLIKNRKATHQFSKLNIKQTG